MHSKWFERIKYAEVKNATYLLVGSGYLQDNNYAHGVIAAACDEFTAYRLAKEINQDSQSKVLVLPNTPWVIEAVEQALLETAVESVVNRKAKPHKSTTSPLRYL